MMSFFPDSIVSVKSGVSSILSIMCGFTQYFFPSNRITSIILQFSPVIKITSSVFFNLYVHKTDLCAQKKPAVCITLNIRHFTLQKIKIRYKKTTFSFTYQIFGI